MLERFLEKVKFHFLINIRAWKRKGTGMTNFDVKSPGRIRVPVRELKRQEEYILENKLNKNETNKYRHEEVFAYCNGLRKKSKDIFTKDNHELVRHDKLTLKDMIIPSTGMSVKMNLKISILENAINGKTFTVIDETGGELQEMIKHADLKVIIEQLENGSTKYTFNSPEQL